MSKEELTKKYHKDVKTKFLELDILSNANSKNTKVIDCFYNEQFKDISLNEKSTNTDHAQTKQLEDSISNEILKIKDTNVKVLLLRIHSPYHNAGEIYNNMDIKKRYIEEYINHSMNVFLFDDIDSGFHSLI